MTGYRAHNTVQIEVRNLDTVGKVIDAVLACRRDESRRAQPVRVEHGRGAPRRVAEGGREGARRRRGSGDGSGRLVRRAARADRPSSTAIRSRSCCDTGMAEARVAMAAPTPVESGEMTVQAVVHVRWQFVPGQR